MEQVKKRKEVEEKKRKDKVAKKRKARHGSYVEDVEEEKMEEHQDAFSSNILDVETPVLSTKKDDLQMPSFMKKQIGSKNSGEKSYIGKTGKMPKTPKIGMSKPSNAKKLKQALNKVYLAGEVQRGQREDVIKSMEACSKKFHQFVILLRTTSGRQRFKGMYYYDGKSKLIALYRSTDKAPAEISPLNITSYFKFDLGSLNCKKIEGMQKIHSLTDAVEIAERNYRRQDLPNVMG